MSVVGRRSEKNKTKTKIYLFTRGSSLPKHHHHHHPLSASHRFHASLTKIERYLSKGNFRRKKFKTSLLISFLFSILNSFFIILFTPLFIFVFVVVYLFFYFLLLFLFYDFNVFFFFLNKVLLCYCSYLSVFV